MRTLHTYSEGCRFRVASLFLLLLLLPAGMRAQSGSTVPEAVTRDTTVVRRTLYFSRGNGDWIERSEYRKTAHLLRWAQTDTVTPIHITGWADKSGTVALNERLSLRRAETVKRYLIKNGIAAGRISIEGCGVDTQAASDDLARRAEVRKALFVAAQPVSEVKKAEKVILNPTPDKKETNSAPKELKPTQQVVQLVEAKAAEQAEAAKTTEVAEQAEKQVAETAQEKAKTLPAVQPKQEQPPTGATTGQQIVPKKEQTAIPQQQTFTETAVETATASESTVTRYLGVKTNLAAWAGTIMNVAADVQVGRHWSVELPVLWCPWYVSDKHAVKTFTIQPEGRYWLSKPGEGHFFGVHAHVGWFSVKWNRDRYQDTDRPLLGAGISYGYLLPFSEHWAGEFTLGAGYANMRYDTYYNIDNGARIDTRTKNYWGITRVGISVVYRFNLKK